jgi:hypothetical protein
MQFGGGGIPPVGVLFDGGFDRIGDILALAVLYGLQSKGEARVTAISVNRADFPAAQFCDVIKRHYTPGGFGAGLPIGAADGKQQPLPLYSKLLSQTGAGAPVFKPAVTRFLDTADPATVLRNALTASNAKNSIVVASGSLATVSRLLALRGAKPLIEGATRQLILSDPKISTDAEERASAQRLFADWPTPICVCGAEIGDAICYPGASIDKDFTGPKPNPIVDAYRAFGDMPYDAPATAADASLFAVRTSANYFRLSDPGTFRISAGGALEFDASPGGAHHRLMLDETQKEAVIKALTELASAPPRAGGGRRGARGDANALPQPPAKKK